MKLAEALILRADAQKQIEQLRQRINDNARIQEGDTPAEDPTALLQEFEQVAAELTRLIQRINATNNSATLESGTTLANALAQRDVLKLRHGVYGSLTKAANPMGQIRYSLSEIKVHSTVDVTEIRAQADDLARQHRELDTQIQAANWLTDLVE